MTIAHETRLDQLRAKTDRELTLLIERRLRLGLSSLASSDEDRELAQQVYAEAQVVLPVIYGLPQTKRKSLESLAAKLNRLLLQDRTSISSTACAAC